MRLFLLVIAVLSVVYTSGQKRSTSFKINDEWFMQYGSKGLKVGDKVPDIPLGTILNNHTGQTSLKGFKGKLVILDFWATSCSNCIASFPKMKKLQEEFGDSIQVILVNPWQTKQQIEQEFAKSKHVLPDLPCVVADRPGKVTSNTNPFFHYFPALAVPHHAWVGPNGTVSLVGSPANTYPAKIRAAIKGEPIFILNDESTVPSIQADENARYYQQLGSLQNTPVSYGNFITPYNNELGGGYKTIIDNVQHSKIVQFINTDLIDIYRYGLNQLNSFPNKTSKNQVLYSPSEKGWLDFLVMPFDIDTSHYSSSKLGANRERNEQEIIPGRYCYEQVTPLSMTEEKRRQYMVEDLNRYFSTNLGTVVNIEQRETACYILVRTSSIDRVKMTNEKASFQVTNVVYEGSKAKQYVAIDLVSALNQIIHSNQHLANLLQENKKHERPWLIANETGWDGSRNIDITLPAEGLLTIGDLRKVLKQYDLDLIEGKRTFDFIVVKKVK